MNDFMRNRLIGVITILLIIIIFFPYMGKKKSFLASHTFSLTSSNDKFITEQIASAAKESNPEIKQDKTLSIVNPVTLVESKTTPVPLTALNSGTTGNKSYIIQLVALKNKKKVEELSALLRLNNYQTCVDPESAGADKIIRLFVGPYHSKEQVESVLVDLNKLTKLKGIMITK